jgi:hypothetical protein
MKSLQKASLVSLLLVVGVASATVPAPVATALTTEITRAGAYGTAFIPLAVAVVVAGLSIKWLKRFFSKAS